MLPLTIGYHRYVLSFWGILLLMMAAAFAAACAQEDQSVEPHVRKPQTPAQWQFWLENMVIHHRYTLKEASRATGVSKEEIEHALGDLGIHAASPLTPERNPLKILPYPGGRHPRIGFLNGAIHPQRETKVSVFTPWNAHAYLVVDVPEAIWFQHGLLYLAHTHIPTYWDQKGIKLQPLEWKREENGTLALQRRLPNHVVFRSQVGAYKGGVRMRLSIHNQSEETLKDLRIQNCVMLKGAPEFRNQTDENKRFIEDYALCRNESGNRWVITAWRPHHRNWANAEVPCIHSDPKWNDCLPGKTQVAYGWLSFFEGKEEELETEIERIEGLGWD